MFSIADTSSVLSHPAFSYTVSDIPSINLAPSKLQAWVYYGAPAQNASDVYKNNAIDVLRVQYFNLLDNGDLKLIKEDRSDLFSTKNAYSQENVRELKQYSQEQLITVSGHVTGMRATNYTQIVRTLVDFVKEHNMTGIDIDFESFNKWTARDYTKYKDFIQALGTELNQAQRKLAICGPMWTSKESPFQWKYEDFKSLPVNYVTPMVYDYQWDYGGGSPITPLGWLKTWTETMLKIFGKNRLVIGIPSYGYLATKGKYDIKNLTLQQIKSQNGYKDGKRDPSSGEVIKTVGNKVYVSNDRESMVTKRKLVESLGVSQISVWHLGGNDWF
ncbi:glycoside hydrolase [Basidiobolus meristosporus CBS 931.73]|uniref:Chitinase domain-containing protein 1 n=1 Tax=Basidiobolus meristosporus CBS 931.73 TaxID=1314790 RepID=A0A1Y1XZ19_9FUNG|nr:glycoside hydrolase [Basidiobolus meristosporus CBS 931.73]|eukprot:ORX90905.1 glycoside hydrolase [Basidiobolus meristosporus CBS 931.73]